MATLLFVAVIGASEPPMAPAQLFIALLDRVDAWSPRDEEAPWAELERLLASPPPKELRVRRDATCQHIFDVLVPVGAGADRVPPRLPPASALPPSRRLEERAHLLDLGCDLWLATGDNGVPARLRALTADVANWRQQGESAAPDVAAMSSEALTRTGLLLGDPELVDLGHGFASGISVGDGLHAHALATVVTSLLRQAQAGGGTAALARAVSAQDDLDARWWRPSARSYGDDEVDALALRALAVLIVLFDDDAWQERHRSLCAGIQARCDPPTPGNALLRLALAEAAGPHGHLIVVAPGPIAASWPLLVAAQRVPPDRLAVLVQDDAPPFARLCERFHALVPMPARDARATAYLCFAQRCLPPVVSAAALTAQLDGELGHR